MDQEPEEGDGHFVVRLPAWTASNKSWDVKLLAVPGMKLVHLRTRRADPDSHRELDAKWKSAKKTEIEWLHTEPPPNHVFAKLNYSNPGVLAWFREMDWKAWAGPVLGLVGVIVGALLGVRASNATAEHKQVMDRAAVVCREALAREVVTAADVDACLQRYRADLKELASFRTAQQVRASQKPLLEKILNIPIEQ